MQQKQIKLYQEATLAELLTFIGGFLDSYSFIQRGNVLSGAQTGNIIILSANLAYKQWRGFFTDLASLIGFGIGSAIITLLNLRYHDRYPKFLTLIPNIIVCFIIGFLPASFSNLVIVLLLSCVLAMQTTAFNSIEGVSYNVVYSTGNLKKFVISWSKYFYTHQKKDLIAGKAYIKIISCFVLGAISSALLQHFIKLHTIWLASIILLIILFYYGHLEHQTSIKQKGN